MKYIKFSLSSLLIGQAVIIVLLGLISGGSLFDLDFFAKMAGIIMIVFVVEGLVVGIIGGWKLLPRYERGVSVDGGENWIIVYKGICPSPRKMEKIEKKVEMIIQKAEAKKKAG